jgi:ABC-type transport system involved in multi-copper enzyme maturation permease subunit
VVWLLIANGLLAFLLWVVPLISPDAMMSATDAVGFFLSLFGAAATLGVMVLAQNLVVREKQLGTAAWVLASPVSRSAFILAKLVAHGTGILALVVVLQFAVAYLQISLRAGDWLPLLPFAAAMGLHALHLLFYLTLALMLGTFFRNRGPVIGFSIAVWFAQQIVGVFIRLIWPELPLFLPGNLPDIAAPVVVGGPLVSAWPIVTAALLSVLFVLAALWRFGWEEF